MILEALSGYYERLSQTDPTLVPFGFSVQKVSFCVVLEPDGSLHAIQDARVDRKGKPVPQLIHVPGQAKPSGSGINPCFLWDNSAYMLGLKADDQKPERTARSFEVFRERHLALESTVADAGFSAVCRFLEKWDPSSADDPAALRGTGFGVFRIRGEHGYVHQRSAVRDYWLRQVGIAPESPTVGKSLVSGTEVPLARLHEPKIKGVFGADPSGALLVSFNECASESYGKTQGYNSPVGELEAFRYCAALNHLLADDGGRKVRIGDATVVFWSDRPAPFEDMFGVVVGERSAEDECVNDRVRGFLERLRRGRACDAVGDAEARFYVLGLSPNGPRLAVRLWLSGTVGEFADRLAQHVRDLEMIGERDGDPPPVIRRLLLETAREPKDIPPQLAGEVARAVLTGGAYPQTMFTAVLRRIRADRRINHRRAAMLKAYLARKFRLAGHRKEIPVSLDTDHASEAYQLGRLFAVVEKTQEDAGLSGLKDSYIGSASATPAAVFPLLLRVHQHHLDKASRRRGARGAGYRISRERKVQGIVSSFARFPSHLSLDDQGLFFIGYYHQRERFFEKRAQKPKGIVPSGDRKRGLKQAKRD